MAASELAAMRWRCVRSFGRSFPSTGDTRDSILSHRKGQKLAVRAKICLLTFDMRALLTDNDFAGPAFCSEMGQLTTFWIAGKLASWDVVSFQILKSIILESIIGDLRIHLAGGHGHEIPVNNEESGIAAI